MTPIELTVENRDTILTRGRSSAHRRAGEQLNPAAFHRRQFYQKVIAIHEEDLSPGKGLAVGHG
jgi:hypothetical protein